MANDLGLPPEETADLDKTSGPPDLQKHPELLANYKAGKFT
jgi:hypothetical protein